MSSPSSDEKFFLEGHAYVAECDYGREVMASRRRPRRGAFPAPAG